MVSALSLNGSTYTLYSYRQHDMVMEVHAGWLYRDREKAV